MVALVQNLNLLVSPAHIMRSYLVFQLYGSLPSVLAEWPIFVSCMPDGQDLNDVICIYDKSSFQHGELPDGQSVEHKGIFIEVRGETFAKARDKYVEISNHLEHSSDILLELDANLYAIDNIVHQYVTHPGYDQRRRFSMVGYFGLCLYRMILV